MSWGRQVVHVAWKDLHEARWLIAAYVLGVAATAGWVAAWPDLDGPPGLGIVLVMVLFLLIAGVFVQSDSPSRVDAFWATRPLSPSAVAMAKVLAAVLAILLPGLLAQAAITFIYGVTPADTLRLVGERLGNEGIILALVLPVAALTRDLRAFVVALVVLLLAGLFGLEFRGSYVASMEVAPAMAMIATAVWVSLVLGLFLYQYRTRNTRRGWVGGITLGALFIVSPRLTGAEFQPASAGSVRVAIDSLAIPDRSGGSPILLLRYAVEGREPGERLVVGPLQVRFRRTDGGTDSVYTIPFPLVDQPPLLLAPDHWIGVHEGPGRIARRSEVTLSDRQLSDIATGRLVVGVRALALVQRPVLVATLPLQIGATARTAGGRLQIGGLQENRNGLTVIIRGLAVEVKPGSPPEVRRFSYALVNDARGEAIELLDAGSSSGVIGLSVTSTPMYSMRQELRLRNGPPTQGAPAIDAAWLRGARLIVVQWRDQFTERFDQEFDSASIRAIRRR